MDNIYMKCKCKNIIPNVRVNLGYKTCVGCSTVEQYGCAPLINHKTGNSIQIMSSSDAAIIAKLTRRRGYGTMLKQMKEIDNMLNTWIYNSIIREELRKLIIKEIKDGKENL